MPLSHRNNDSVQSVFNTPLLGSPPPSRATQMTPTPTVHQQSPVSPAETLPPISPSATSPPVKLKSIKELGLSSGPSEWRRAQSAGPSTTLSTPTVVSASPTTLSQLDLRDHISYYSDGEDDATSPWHRRRKAPVGASPLQRSIQAPSDIGKLWWDGVVGAHATSQPSPRNSPIIRLPKPADDDEVDELMESEYGPPPPPVPPTSLGESSRTVLLPSMQPQAAPSRPRPSSYSPSYALRPLPRHTTSSPMVLPSHHRFAASTGPAYTSLPPSPSVSPSPAYSTISLPGGLSPSGRRTKPNHLNRQNVPLYNRSKQPASGEHFMCGYVPPRSTNPRAPQPTSQPCETTALKKADMERHYEEIHAKDEAERVLRGELEVEYAYRYLIDLASIVSKEMKADPLGSSLLPTPGRTIRNLDLRAQADNVRLRVQQLILTGATTPFDFPGNTCEAFRDVAVARLATYRVWRCPEAGCNKQFGSQRSMERHRTNKHPPQASGSAGTKRSAPAEFQVELGLGLAGPSSSKRPRVATAPVPGSSGPAMRVRHQTPVEGVKLEERRR